MSRSKFNVFRDGHVWVCSRLCDTCIFREGTPVQAPGLKLDSVENGGIVVCHSTYKWRNRRGRAKEQNLVCFGSFKVSSSMELRLADAMGVIRFVDPPKLTELS